MRKKQIVILLTFTLVITLLCCFLFFSSSNFSQTIVTSDSGSGESNDAVITNDTLNNTSNYEIKTYFTHIPFEYYMPDVNGFVQDFLSGSSSKEENGVISYQDSNQNHLLLQGNNYSSFTFSKPSSRWYNYALSQFGSPSFGPKYLGFKDFIGNAGKNCSFKNNEDTVKEVQKILSISGNKNEYDFTFVGGFTKSYLLQCAESNKEPLLEQVQEIPQLQKIYDYIYADGTDGSYENGLEDCYVVVGDLLVNDIPVNSCYVPHDDQFIYQAPFLFCIFSKSGLVYIHFDGITAESNQGTPVSGDQLISCEDAIAITNDEIVNWENEGYSFNPPTLQYITQATSNGLQLFLCWCQTGYKDDLVQTVCVDAVTGEIIF